MGEIKTALPRAVCFVRSPDRHRPQHDEFDVSTGPPPRWIMDELSDSTRLERKNASERHLIAGITKPLRTWFRRDLDPDLDAAMDTLWRTGPRSRDLYLKIGKGVATLEREDLLALVSLPPDWIEEIAPFLTAGMTFGQALGEPCI
jgi:hypothetical protein